LRVLAYVNNNVAPSWPRPAAKPRSYSSQVGYCALEAFNQLSADPFLAPVPAVLLVNSKQQAIADQAHTDALRKVAVMPIGGGDMLKLIQSVTALPG
jgi:hypothetical protein